MAWVEEYEALQEGELVFIKANADGFADKPPAPKPFITIYGKIDRESFPSWRDYSGGELIVEDGTPVLVIRYVGRCWRILPEQELPDGKMGSDVYQVLVKDKLYQVLRCWVRKDNENSGE